MESSFQRNINRVSRATPGVSYMIFTDFRTPGADPQESGVPRLSALSGRAMTATERTGSRRAPFPPFHFPFLPGFPFDIAG